MKRHSILGLMVVCLGGQSGSFVTAQAAVPAKLVAAVGDVPPGSDGLAIGTLNQPFTNGNREVGFTGNLINPQGGNIGFVWFHNGVIWKNTDDQVNTVTGVESTMGISNNGEFIYSPSVNAKDSAYSNLGPVLKAGDPAPGFPGMFSTFNSRPTMKPDGTAYWVGGAGVNPDGGITQQRALYKSTGAGGGPITPIFKTGDVIDGFTIQSPSGISFDYDVSDNNAHYIAIVDTTEAAAADLFIMVNGAMVAREGSSTGGPDNWSVFDLVAINNHGHYLFSGNTSGPAATDEFVAYNGSIVVREGDTLDGITLASGATLRAISLNNLDQAVHLWGWGSGANTMEVLFFGDGADLGLSSIKILAIGDLVDIDGDGIADWQVFDFNASAVVGPGLDLADDGFVFVNVDLGPIGGAGEFAAILRLAVPEPGSAVLLLAAALLIRRRRW